jgi:hypothetical protein
MRGVTIKVPRIELPCELAAMRNWLDRHRCEQYKFTTSNRYHEIVGICFEFTNDADAEAFAARFQHTKAGNEPDILLDQGQQWLLRFSGGDSESGGSRGTMAQACWWRLKAEEARAEGEAFSSPSAKQTMQIVAMAWDSMAEELERRLARTRR